MSCCGKPVQVTDERVDGKSSDEIRQMVKEQYGRVAKDGGDGACCDGTARERP